MGAAKRRLAAGFNADEAKQKLFLLEKNDFALPRSFCFWGKAFSRAGECGRNARLVFQADGYCYLHYFLFVLNYKVSTRSSNT